VITQLGVYGFDEESKKLELLALHPGVSLDQVQANSQFEILVRGQVPESEPPTPEERLLLQEIDPRGMVLGK
jgi:acyl CoA:acetate/3-ketoacid CoA transferase beta subunit